jgi:hypothetical protein
MIYLNQFSGVASLWYLRSSAVSSRYFEIMDVAFLFRLKRGADSPRRMTSYGRRLSLCDSPTNTSVGINKGEARVASR